MNLSKQWEIIDVPSMCFCVCLCAEDQGKEGHARWNPNCAFWVSRAALRHQSTQPTEAGQQETFRCVLEALCCDVVAAVLILGHQNRILLLVHHPQKTSDGLLKQISFDRRLGFF